MSPATGMLFYSRVNEARSLALFWQLLGLILRSTDHPNLGNKKWKKPCLRAAHLCHARPATVSLGQVQPWHLGSCWTGMTQPPRAAPGSCQGANSPCQAETQLLVLTLLVAP